MPHPQEIAEIMVCISVPVCHSTTLLLRNGTLVAGLWQSDMAPPQLIHFPPHRYPITAVSFKEVICAITIQTGIGL